MIKSDAHDFNGKGNIVMKYEKIIEGVFLDRPNRFIANVKTDGQIQRCHVCNTGRCKELLVPGCKVYLKVCDNPSRSTAYDLVVVEKQLEDGTLRIVNMDSYAPNRVAREWLEQGGMGKDITAIASERRYGNSRIDLYFEQNGKKAFMEVKGVTLEKQGIAAFPDAPTERGIKHIHELCQCVKDGYEAYLLFVIQMEQIDCFVPNDLTHPEFGQALREAEKAGVHILARECVVTENTLDMGRAVPVRL